jgi:hypothetical protein
MGGFGDVVEFKRFDMVSLATLLINPLGGMNPRNGVVVGKERKWE